MTATPASEQADPTVPRGEEPEHAEAEPKPEDSLGPVAEVGPVVDTEPQAETAACPVPDTVAQAARSQTHQAYAQLGLRQDEYAMIRQILGRRPTRSELAMYSIMWSEQCSEKSSKVHLRQFSERAPASGSVTSGIGGRAGVIRISEDIAVAFTVGAYNRACAVEPGSGAAAAIGAIVRDVLAMGARPAAIMNSLRFGRLEDRHNRRALGDVVAGMGGYANRIGVPTIGGELEFDPSYQDNPLVNVLCVGVLPVERLQYRRAAGPGSLLVLLGSATGRDGLAGLDVLGYDDFGLPRAGFALARPDFAAPDPMGQPDTQVGDPFAGKLLVEACLDLCDRGLVEGVADVGRAGLVRALAETAAAAGTGIHVDLDRIPLRDASMLAYEVLASESPERMLLIVTPSKIEEVLALSQRWGVPATVVGMVTEATDGEPPRLSVARNGELVVELPPASLVEEGPMYARPMRQPGDLILMQADRAETLRRPRDPDELRATLLDLLASANLADRSWVAEQFDRYVGGNTVLGHPHDAAVLRLDESSGLGIAVSVDGNGRYCRLDPYTGAKLALGEAYRNVATTGAIPVAVTNCLNFGSPEDPAVMWQFAETVRGLADGCAELGIPASGGEVSFFNGTGAAAVNPTPVVAVLGVFEQVANRVPIGFEAPGDTLILLGETADELSGSQWAWVRHGHLGGRPPRVNLVRERILARVLTAAAELGHFRAAHDCSQGGLAQTLVESCLVNGIGATIAVPDGADPFEWLFSETAARALVAVRRGHDTAFLGLCAEHGLPYTAIGVTNASETLEVEQQFSIGLGELGAAWRAPFNGPAHAPSHAVGDPAVAASGVAASAFAELSPADVVSADAASADAADPESPAEPDDSVESAVVPGTEDAGDLDAPETARPAPDVPDIPGTPDVGPDVPDVSEIAPPAPDVPDIPGTPDVAPDVPDGEWVSGAPGVEAAATEPNEAPEASAEQGEDLPPREPGLPEPTRLTITEALDSDTEDGGSSAVAVDAGVGADGAAIGGDTGADGSADAAVSDGAQNAASIPAKSAPVAADPAKSDPAATGADED